MSLVTSLVLATLIWFIAPAHAQERFGDFGVGHDEWHHWYSYGENGGPLMRPNMEPWQRNPCCNKDCRPTKAKVDAQGHWTVWIDGEWQEVPQEKLKTDVPNPSVFAHVCASKRWPGVTPIIFCFIPPEAEG